ncbi:LAME_0D03708g1_1 [Lachancea meyersii CBS 8951]|uniref:Derlin n=1 Tax=Lachancea meyersii CBS 8951 TaxID=1266667 RepID=A0A1G4J7R9_9SACH|nr:LAME_0D03708g1_1 [Lachancea meyersii CBS 8951]
MPNQRKSTQQNELAQLVAQIPPVTRFVLLAIVVLYTLLRAGILSDVWFYFWPYETFLKLQIWRMITGPLIIRKGKLATLFTLFEFYTHSSHLENYHFHGKDHTEYVYLLCVLLTGLVCSVTLLRIDCPFTLVDGFMAALTCLWSIKNWNTSLMFYGLFPIKGKYNPLLQLFLSYLFDDEQHTFPLIAVGFVVAYVYNCLDTRSLGPLYGYIRSKASGYGLVNDRHFRAPRWFLAIWGFLVNNQRRTVNVIVKNTHSYQGQGRKLGSKNDGKDKEADANANAKDMADLRAARAATYDATSPASNLNFRGVGRRVGSK